MTMMNENKETGPDGLRLTRSMSADKLNSSGYFNQKYLKPFNTEEIKILLLENVSSVAVEAFKSQSYQVEFHPKALSEEVLKEKIKDVHAIGIRSKTQLTKEVLECARELLVIGCFCIGTNQVDLEYAASRGISVFNSPFSNSRSVAEMTIANIINLSRFMFDRSSECHRGAWFKSSTNCHEIRGKTLGIIGYGHIGSQLSVLAESMGLRVCFFDILPIMPLGCAIAKDSLNDLLAEADFVSLHVPATPETKLMIGEQQLDKMKKGSYLINASRGTVVDIPALARKLKSGDLAGAAIDVYPKEPRSNCENGFETELQGCPNTILTPHVGGSTEEAQSAIGLEVSMGLTKYINNGTSTAAVNFPEADLREVPEDNSIIRVCNVHENVPGVLRQINMVLSDFNILKQNLESSGSISYFLADIKIQSSKDLEKIYKSITKIKENIRTRVLY